MKKLVVFILVTVMLVAFTSCTKQKNDSSNNAPLVGGGNTPNAPTLILNGKQLDVYTSHYNVTEEYASIPLSAFLQSLGAEYADSPMNEYGVQCYSFMDNRYIINGRMHLFMFEEDYKAFLKELNDTGKKLSKETASERGLLPKNQSKVLLNTDETNIEYTEIWSDHESLMNALRESGIDITIEYDFETRAITVTLKE
ncbi:MAG: hypothetical protein IKC01_04205 [Clostridia bacterium]|nr:hypothetical protein [Clostridia bacterium]